MLDKLIQTPLAVVQTLFNVLKSTSRVAASDSSSLVDFTKATRVEPIVLLDPSVQNLPYTEDIMKSVLAMFSAYYLQAVAISVNIGKVDTRKLLDHLNPDRYAPDSLSDVTSAVLAQESVLLDPRAYKNGLPRLTKTVGNGTGIESANVEVNFPKPRFSLEAAIPVGDPEFKQLEEDNLTLGPTRLDKKAFEVLDAGHLFVGNLLDVQIESNGHKATIPVLVRLIPTVMRSDVLVHILANNERDVSLSERWYELTTGQIRFWKDFILCEDLIDEHRKTLLKDDSGQYAEMLKRRRKNRNAAMLTKRPSVATASNIVIISETTKKRVEAATGAEFKNFKARERIFDATFLMLVVVVDPEWETATIYHRGIALPTKLTVKNMKLNNKGKGVDIKEILTAYQLGNSPSI